MLINKRVKIYVVVFEANTNSSNIPQGRSQYYDCHKTIGLGGGGVFKTFLKTKIIWEFFKTSCFKRGGKFRKILFSF